jgi:tetratricopeptide (TPR) repeat protein
MCHKACILSSTKFALPEVDVNPLLLLLLEGLSFVVVFGALSLFRREGLSIQFAVEVVIITVIAAGLTAFTPFPVNPILLLIVIYLVAMRVRLLVDLGTLLAQRGQFARADRVFALALRLWPDDAGRLIVQVNQGAAYLKQNILDKAIAIFQDVLQKAGQGYLGVKYEAAAHYNLGVAYRRKKMDAQSAVEFNAVLDTWPTSVYARRAEMALEQNRHKEKHPTTEKDAPGEDQGPEQT